MSLLGELTYFLGLQIQQKEGGIFLSQTKYLKQILKKYGMEDAKPVCTPMVTGCSLSANDEYAAVHQPTYRSMIGSLLYLTGTRPDIMHAVGIVGRFQANPKETHLQAVKRIFKYLQETQNYGLWYLLAPAAAADALLTSAARKAEKASRREKSRISELQIKKQRQFRMRASLREIGHFGESSGNLLIVEPTKRRKSPKIPQSCQRIRFEDKSRSFTEFKVYQIKLAGIKHVKEYQSTAETINVAAKCIREYLEQRPKARKIEYLPADSQKESETA
eukprot:PITA_30751